MYEDKKEHKGEKGQMMNSPIIEFDVHGMRMEDAVAAIQKKGGSGRNCRLQDPGDPRIQ